jgi:hypothetical protein
VESHPPFLSFSPSAKIRNLRVERANIGEMGGRVGGWVERLLKEYLMVSSPDQLAILEAEITAAKE